MPRRYQFLNPAGDPVDLVEVEAAIAELTGEQIDPDRFIETYNTMVKVAFFHLMWACGRYSGQTCTWLVDPRILDEYCEALGGPPIQCSREELTTELWGKLRQFIDGTRYRFEGWG